MYGEAGDFFFHYTTADAAFRHIVPSRELRLSPYSRMADPLESKEWIFGGSFWLGVRGTEEEAAMQRHAELVNLINHAREATKVLSLSVDAEEYGGAATLFGRGYARASMWQLYADNHAGVCLLFDRRQLATALRPQLEAIGPAFDGRVSYRKAGIVELPLAARRFTRELFSGDDQADIERHVTQHHEALFFTKLADWANEWEYRFIAVGRSDDYERCSIDGSLRAVVLGERFPRWQQEGAERLCETAHADLLQLRWEHFRPILHRV